MRLLTYMLFIGGLAGSMGLVAYGIETSRQNEARYQPTLNYSIVSDRDAMGNVQSDLRDASIWVRENQNIDCYHLGATVRRVVEVNLMSIKRDTQTPLSEYNGKTAFEAFSNDSEGIETRITEMCLNDPNENMLDTSVELLNLSSKAQNYLLAIYEQ